MGLKLVQDSFLCRNKTYPVPFIHRYSLFTVLTVQESKNKGREDTHTAGKTLCATRVELRGRSKFGASGKVWGHRRLDRRKDDLSKGAKRQKNLSVGVRGAALPPSPLPPPAQQKWCNPLTKMKTNTRKTRCCLRLGEQDLHSGNLL